jgi:hypothetical protein
LAEVCPSSPNLVPGGTVPFLLSFLLSLSVAVTART